MYSERPVIKTCNQDFSLFVKCGTRHVRTRFRRITTFVVIVTETDTPKIILVFLKYIVDFNTVYFRQSCSLVSYVTWKDKMTLNET